MGWWWYVATSGCHMIQVDGGDCFRADQLGADTPFGNWLSKLLQSRLVEEGWDIVIHMDIFGRFEIIGKKGEIKIRLGYFTRHINKNNEPEAEAIVALYCKVKGIEVEK
jgi:hypothetical protein